MAPERKQVTAAPGRLDASVFSHLPFRFDTGVALFAKRTPRPFPPPFLSPPSSSFTDPLSTHDRSRDRRRGSRDRRAYVDGHLIQGLTNGDDAVFESPYFIGANDGVGAWSTRPRGHAGLWARLILHFWATSIFEDAARQGEGLLPDPLAHLQRAYEQTIEATGPPNDWQGTTTAAGAQLHYRRVPVNPVPGDNLDTSSATTSNNPGPDPETTPTTTAAGTVVEPLLYVTNLGDSQIMVIRPSTREIIYKSAEQWHWFDCPRQLGTNSPDTPRGSAVVDEVPIREGDVVLAMSDGVIDNLWAHEIAAKVVEALERWGKGEGREFRRRYCDEFEEGGDGDKDGVGDDDDGIMEFVADEVMEAARTIAVDPFAESPFMEHAIEEGLASGGGKLDDISVVAAIFGFSSREGLHHLTMGKRAKQYKKLMRAFQQLGFREPYQLLITSDVILDTIKLDLVALFQKTLSTKGVKPMITQCSIRQLYAKNVPGPNKDPNITAAIERAKTFERRRCGHLMDQDALPERECVMSCVDPKGKGENKFRYVVVTQDEYLRDKLRSVVPTPLMYVRRSVMILEPMSESSAQVRLREERSKFLDGIIRRGQKRKREEDDDSDSDGHASEGEGEAQSETDQPKESSGGNEEKPKKKKKKYGPKGPNPLSVKKSKKKSQPGEQQKKPKKPTMAPTAEASGEKKAKRKRRKKGGAHGGEGGGDGGGSEKGGNSEAATVNGGEGQD
ncbi:hypothetical protein VTJ49DRAFT_4550 [Mycothermus thermophilus]|uniref:Protein phosphatase n=1 Tax=Humicola insolens TaxID=85995 RepID=A0ABR3V575_HUMIN